MPKAKWTHLLLLPLVLALAGCPGQWAEVYAEGRFLGTFTGYAELEDGTPVGLRVETVLEKKEEYSYTFSGQALLDGTSYRLEGEERSSDDRVHYQAVPPPRSEVTATLFDEVDAPRYQLVIHIYYHSSWPGDGLAGSIYEGNSPIGTVRLQRSAG